MLIYIRQMQSKIKPQPGANPLAVILGWLLFGALLLLGLFLGLVFLLVGWILLLPVMWRKRRQLKQMWQFSKATRQTQQQARRQAQNAYQQRQNRQDDSVIEGEYEVKRDDSQS